jgi:drug/metabolite transporter (DMT)-like permease
MVLGPALALASAALYGLVDYAGGMLSRRVHFAIVSLLGQVGGLIIAVALALLVTARDVQPIDLVWGAVSGLGSAVTMLFLNRGISRGALSLVVPVSAVTGIALSVVCGVAILGDRPGVPAWLGIALILPSLWFVTGGRLTGTASAARDGLLASLGVAAQYVALGLAGEGSGLWPVAAGRVAAVLIMIPVLLRSWPTPSRPADTARAMIIGVGAALALILYQLAVHQQLLAIVVTLASLYPAIPVVLGIVIHHEKVTRTRVVGLIGSMAAVLLLTLG